MLLSPMRGQGVKVLPKDSKLYYTVYRLKHPDPDPLFEMRSDPDLLASPLLRHSSTLFTIIRFTWDLSSHCCSPPSFFTAGSGQKEKSTRHITL